MLNRFPASLASPRSVLERPPLACRETAVAQRTPSLKIKTWHGAAARRLHPSGISGIQSFLSLCTRCLSVTVNKHHCVGVRRESEYKSESSGLWRESTRASTSASQRADISRLIHKRAPAALGLGTEPARHSRTKRCSCASFLDKECVYFCHLDIIWVNTPERTVSYGLGNAPRKKRSVTEPVMPFSRCKCAESRDKTCSLFCRTDTTTTKSEATSHGPIHHCAEKKCKQKMQMTR
ncbi:hypothetical protein DNTS_032719 [Danionella cerebrum]|uniref:Endothelin-1 n=1 Tax=Danionella cerebrum TaxID=2873325 RepID=A0A553Q7Q6_9TELE|nr:hypothetical protein DNTS_032719 [Danionella translucida]